MPLPGQARRALETPSEFSSSPLYRELSRTVAAQDRLLDLASRGRHGQCPTFLFFGAVQYLLLSGVEHLEGHLRWGRLTSSADSQVA